MRKYLTPIYIVLFLIGATALWYFGHHRPAQKILEAEPKKIYKSTPLPPKSLSVKPVPSDAVQKPREAVEDIDNAAMSEKIDDSEVHSEDVDSKELASQEAISVDDPAAAEAYEKYLTAEANYQAAKERLKKALTLRLDQHKEIEKAFKESDVQAGQEGLDKVLDPKNRDQVWSAVEAYKEAQLRRKEALQNLAPYSEEAVKMLEEMEAAERRVDERSAEFDAEMAEFDAEIRSLENQNRDINNLLKELQDLRKAQ